MAITEYAHLKIKQGEQAAFEAAAAKAVAIFQAAPGCLGMRVERGVEHDHAYTLIVDWTSLEDHTVTFRNSAGFQQWRGLVGSFFAEPPNVYHTQNAVAGFAA